MDYRKYLFQTKNKKPWWKYVIKYGKIALYIFFIVSFLWGCGQFMGDKRIATGVVETFSGKTVKIGIFFEIAIVFDPIKSHVFHYADGQIYEYGYNAIHTWGQAWTHTTSPFFGVFVYPIAWILAHLVHSMGGPYNGYAPILGIFITALLVRLITLVFSWKGQRGQERMTDMQVKQAEIQAKYKNSSDPQAKQKMQMELTTLYKKAGVNPLGAFGVMFLSFPFLYAMFITIRSTAILKVANAGAIEMVVQPWDGMSDGNWAYIAIVLIYIPLQLLSSFLPTILKKLKHGPKKVITEAAKKAARKQLIINLVFVVVFLFFVLKTPAGTGIYWIFSAFFQVVQTIIFHYANQSVKRYQAKRDKGEIDLSLKALWRQSKNWIKNQKEKLKPVRVKPEKPPTTKKISVVLNQNWTIIHPRFLSRARG